MEEIPLGQRACRLIDFSCPGCAQQKVLVEDFLKVRDTEVVEKRSLYSSIDFL